MKFDMNRITEHFLRITGVSQVEFHFYPLISSAAETVASRLLKDISALDESETAACEYAAACFAVFDYAFELCLTRETVMTESGTVKSQRADRSVLESAGRLKANAEYKLMLSGIYSPEGRLFMSV